MFRKIVFVMSLILIITNTHAFFSMFSDNPAYIATRYHSEIYVPGTVMNFHFDNSLLSFKDFEMFQADHVLTSAEKRLLTKKNLDIYASFGSDFLHYGYQNWDFTLSLHGLMRANILDKQFTKIVFYGNELDKKYTMYNGDDTYFVSFAKMAMRYGHQTAFQLDFINEVNTPYPLVNNVVDHIREMPIYFGANMNLYTPLAYGEVVESKQEFGTTPESNFYDYTMHYIYSDDETLNNAQTHWGFGLGFKAELPDGWFYFHLDDIFASLTYRNLAGGLYEGTYIDSLLYFDEDFEPFDESYENDSLRVSRKRYSLSPSVKFGVEHGVWEDFSISVQYYHSKFNYQKGFSFGVEWDKIDWLPLKFTIGSAENRYYEFRSGLNFKHFQLLVAPIYYNGFFSRTKGLGFRTGMKVTF